MLVSGRIPILSLQILIQIFFITVFTTGTLVLSWYWRKGELTVGILSITTLVVLLLSPGGPINPAPKDGESGLSLMFPVFVLVLLTTASVIYHFGNPLAKNTLHRSRYQVTLLLSGFLIVSALTLGQQFVYDISQDNRTPKFKEVQGIKDQIRNAEGVLSTLRNKNLPERGLFYQLGSEIALSEYYRNKYFQVSSSLTVPPQNNNSDRNNILNSLRTYFSRSSLSQTSYLSDRLLLVHPTVRKGNNQLDLNLPGITAKDRFEALSNKRIISVMSGQQNLLLKFYNIFQYNQEVIESLGYSIDEQNKQLLFSKERERLRIIQDNQKYYESLFPSLPVRNYNTDFFHEQLALPEPEELYVAYAIYRDVAPRYQASSIQKVKAEFNKLKPEVQKAFIVYVTDGSNLNNYKIIAKIVEEAKNANLKIPNLEAQASSIDIIGLRTLIEPGPKPGSMSESNIVKQFADVINKIFQSDAQEKQGLSELLGKDTPEIPISNLFNEDTYKFISDIQSQLGDQQKIVLFSILKDPVTPTIQRIAETLSPYQEQKDWLPSSLKKFTQLTPENQEAILQHLAIATYRAQGAYSLEPLSLLIFQAQSLSYWLAFLCATILLLPIIFIAILLGGFFGSKLVERDRTRELIAAERSHGEQVNQSHTLGIPVELQGREDFLERLKKLSGRGWSTIAVVGRRGVGKSRILHELYQPSISTSSNYGVRVWISAPSQYQEEDFIESTLELLALNAEKAVAQYLEALPFTVRRLEALLANSGLVVFVIATSILAFLLLMIYGRLQRPEVMITWFPILLVVVASISCLVAHLAHLQPLDLSPWLESDRTYSPHTVLLYRRIQEVFKYIRSRQFQVGKWLGLIGNREVLVTIVGLVFGLAVGFLIAVSSNSTPAFWLFFIASSIISGIAVYKTTGKELRSGRGDSLMSLISEYRNFATIVVYRIEQGALSQGAKNVMICIDELDKIIELDELRDFLRRMKGIFEIPGVYYYLSLSEDALAALYLGSAEGKNEVDSSFDHIVRIPPLSWEKSQDVAKNYLEKRQFSQLNPKMVDVLVAISFGIPRDILRCCDELMASKTSVITEPQQFVEQKRKEQVEIAADSHAWSIQQRETLKGEPFQSAKAARRLLEKINDTASNLRELRVLVFIWILCCIECAYDLEDSKRQALLKKLYDLGYSITLSLPSDLIAQMDQLGIEPRSG